MKKIIWIGLLFVIYIILAPLFFTFGMIEIRDDGDWFVAFISFLAAYGWAWNAKIQFDRMKDTHLKEYMNNGE